MPDVDIAALQARVAALEAGQATGTTLASFEGGNFGYQMVDPTFPARCRFLIPTRTVRINKALLHFSLQPFRAAIQSATGGGTTSGSEGSHTHGVSWGDHSHSTPGHAHGTPSHNHQIASWQGAANVSATPFGVNQYNFATSDGGSWVVKNLQATSTTPVDLWTPVSGGSSTTPSGGASTSGAGGATATSSAGGSAHTHTVPSSGLSTPNALYETGMAGGCRVLIDGTDITPSLGGPWGNGTNAMDVHDLDVSQWLMAKGWHEVQITSTSLGGIFPSLAIFAVVGV